MGQPFGPTLVAPGVIELDFIARRGEFQLAARASLPSTGITGVFGRSGAGKSTLVNAIAGVAADVSGRIEVDGQAFLDSASGVRLAIEARRVGYVFQDARLFPHLRVETNLRYGARRAPADGPVALWENIIEALDLSQLLRRWPDSLSGGERQRVAIGRALLARPRLMLMDEPLASLDAPRKSEILHYIERLREACPVPMLYVSHALDELVRIADHLLLLSEGKVMASGPFIELIADSTLQPYLGRFEAGSVLECVVKSHDEPFGLSVLGFVGGELRVPQLDAPLGTRLRARLRARDVALALSDPVDLSITNRVKGTVMSLTFRDGPYVDVLLNASGAHLHALVTRESCARLGLAAGVPVIALIKAVALDSRAVGYARRSR